jgi:predicted DNA-binding protein
MPREPTRLLSVRVPRRVSARIATLSKKRKVPVSTVVREALEQYANEEPSIWDAAEHLFTGGRFRGPKDLSTDEKHLDGYGE